MTDVVPDHTEAAAVPGRLPIPALTAPPPDTEDTARHIGEIFRRLALAAETFPPRAYARVVAAVLVALGKAVLLEAETQTDRLRERAAPAGPSIKVSASARRVDFDGWDPGDSDSR